MFECSNVLFSNVLFEQFSNILILLLQHIIFFKEAEAIYSRREKFFHYSNPFEWIFNFFRIDSYLGYNISNFLVKKRISKYYNSKIFRISVLVRLLIDLIRGVANFTSGGTYVSI